MEPEATNRVHSRNVSGFRSAVTVITAAGILLLTVAFRYVGRLREGQDGGSQRSPSPQLLLWIAVPEVVHYDRRPGII
jgi:hypothetical protein